MKKLFLSILVVSNLVSCTTSNDVKSNTNEFVGIMKDINNNADDIIICMQNFHFKIDSLSINKSLTYDNVNSIKQETSTEMKQLLRESKSLSIKLNKLKLTSSQYTIGQRLLIRTQTSGSAFLTIDDLTKLF